jgi:hypothetical protein
MTGGVTLQAAAAWTTEVTRHGVWSVVDGLDASLVRVNPWWRTHRCQPFTAALDGKIGRDQQQSNGGEVTDINAVRRSERDQDRSFWEGFNDHEPNGHGGKDEGLVPAAAALGGSRHLQRVTTQC